MRNLNVLVLIAFVCLLSDQAFGANYKKKCEGLDYKSCLHSQGLYTDDELENMNINEVEVAIHQDKNSQINGKFINGVSSKVAQSN